MRANAAENHAHKKGCLSYKTLLKRTREQSRQLSTAFTEVTYLQRYKAAVQTAPFVDRFIFAVTGNDRRLCSD